ncbi:MAG: tetratricopeptide repeat protein [Chitinophagaceae bacterium]|nr:tetratricopeptide repeat protein [Chitinophagaceae bacterium]
MPLRVSITKILFCFLSILFWTWQELNDSLIYYFKEGEYEKALLFAEKAKRTAQSEFGETHINYNKSLTNLAIVYDRKGMLSEAESVRIKVRKSVK